MTVENARAIKEELDHVADAMMQLASDLHNLTSDQPTTAGFVAGFADLVDEFAADQVQLVQEQLAVLQVKLFAAHEAILRK